MLVDIFWCNPVKENWSLQFRCLTVASIELVQINWVLSFSCYLAIFILPFFLLQYISSSRSEKLGLVGVFGLGAIAMATSILRFVFLSVSDGSASISEFMVVYETDDSHIRIR
jgi:hypothetical protein